MIATRGEKRPLEIGAILVLVFYCPYFIGMDLQLKGCKCKNSCLSVRGRIPCPCRVSNEKCTKLCEFCTCENTRFKCSNLDEKILKDTDSYVKSKPVPFKRKIIKENVTSKKKKTTKSDKNTASFSAPTIASALGIESYVLETITDTPADEKNFSFSAPALKIQSFTQEKNADVPNRNGNKNNTSVSATPLELETSTDVPDTNAIVIATINKMTEMEVKSTLINIFTNTNLSLGDFYTLNEKSGNHDDPNSVHADSLTQENQQNNQDSQSPSPSPISPLMKPVSWCYCGNCVEMPTPDERVCCINRRGRGCITEGPFRAIVLNRMLLRIQMVIRNDVGALRMGNDDKSYRHAAYRQYTYWQYGRLGPKNRKVVPSCAVKLIRRAFPDPNGNYTGYIRPIIVRRREPNAEIPRPQQPNNGQVPRPQQPNNGQVPRLQQPNNGVDPRQPQPNNGIVPRLPQPNNGVVPRLPQPNNGVVPRLPQPNNGVVPRLQQPNGLVPRLQQPNDLVPRP